jgi:hypothetical protein
MQMTVHAAAYDDGRIRCDDQELIIAMYYLWGAKRIPYTAIRDVQIRPLTAFSAIGKWRIWGSGDFVHWLNLDPSRPNKSVALVIDVGRAVYPTITPDDPDAVAAILAERSGVAAR